MSYSSSSLTEGHKLFVGNLPPDVTEGELLRLFCEYGELLEVFVMGGERSRSGQSSAFVKYATVEACDRAIAGVNQRGKIRPSDSDTVVVKFAKAVSTKKDMKRESPDTSSVFPSTAPSPSLEQPSTTSTKYVHPPMCKLFIGGLPSFVDRDDLIAIFSPFGHIDSVHLMQGKSKSGQACAFITYQYPGPAQKAIDVLSGVYVIDEGSPGISVRFADSEGASSPVCSVAPPPKRLKSRDGIAASPPFSRDHVDAAAMAAAIFIVGSKGG